ncbi:hypothetical protein Drose_02255 [Dactylosporangium roseum]|uniref:Secreted protein n=1 Tax=Dactylosporangium roseum TaxID=47989 RepID=A0ABY5Z5N4_9ACTN|nr:hypothetical protein [Dactylosporangium roseum]UWZ37157.1 hypothetical protein Drose_02255 [Dactylosporangium roseum]
MNTWFRRAVGTVGVAGGMLLLGAGAAHADDTALAPGKLDDLLAPSGSLALHAESSVIDTSTATTAEAGKQGSATGTTTQVGRQVPNVLRDLPLSTLLPTDALGLPRTTSSRMPTLPALPTDAVPLPGAVPAEDSLAGLPLAGGLGDLDALGLPGADSLRGTSIANTRTALPGTRSARAAEALPLVGGLPLLGNGLPIRGTLKPVDDFGIPLGGTGRATEADALPLIGQVPLGGSDVLKNDSVTGVPVVGGIGPTPGISTTAAANRLVPTTGALPQVAGQLPLVTEKAYAPKHSATYIPRHAQTEALPVVGNLPLLGGNGLPLVGNLLGG